MPGHVIDYPHIIIRSGPLLLPSGASEMVERVIKTYEAWYKVWSDSYIPKLMFKPKWFNTDTDLKLEGLNQSLVLTGS